MSYYIEQTWEVIPKGLPEVIRNCPKCGSKTNYINTEKFRINANKGSVDIWMIFGCRHCKSTYNLPLYERVKAKSIPAEEYRCFLDNDQDTIHRYSFRYELYDRHKAEVDLHSIDYEVKVRETLREPSSSSVLLVRIQSASPINMRLDSFLCRQLGISRSRIKKMYQQGLISCNTIRRSLREKVSDGQDSPDCLEIRILLP